MIVPLLLGCLVNTFYPQVFAYFDGTFTYSLWKGGSMSLLAAFLFCNGTTINFKEAGVTVYKGVVLTAAKVLSGMICGLLVGMIFGENGIFGIAPIAIIACFSNSNGGIYAALAGEYGDGTDVGAVSILALNDGPFFTMLALGAAGYSVPVNTLAGCVVPILAGVILGNLVFMGFHVGVQAHGIVDVFVSLSTVATRNNYVKPQINEKGTIQIKGGRHPVVEKMMRDDMFVANDTILDNSKNRISIITGPNMAGKSTYMRQTALIVLMAQIGSFVPADQVRKCWKR